MLEDSKAASRACAAALLARCGCAADVLDVFSGGAIGDACRGFLASIAIAASTSDAFISSVDPSSDQVAFHRSLSDPLPKIMASAYPTPGPPWAEVDPTPRRHGEDQGCGAPPLP